MSSKHRAQILLEQEQHKTLRLIAQRENRSMSELVREILGEYLNQQEAAILWQQRMETVERLGRIREGIEAEYGVYQGDLIEEAREEQKVDQERIWQEQV